MGIVTLLHCFVFLGLMTCHTLRTLLALIHFRRQGSITGSVQHCGRLTLMPLGPVWIWYVHVNAQHR